MKAKEGEETIYISYISCGGLGVERTVALYRQATNTLEMLEGYAKLLPKALKALQKLQKEYRAFLLPWPIKVEYW